MEHIFTVEGLIAVLTLTILEIVLGIDNIIFISLVTNKLEEKDQPKARSIGIGLALVMRIAMIFGISWIIQFNQPLFGFELFDTAFEFSGRDLILLGGGLFLIVKSIGEINHKMRGQHEESDVEEQPSKTVSLKSTIFQIVMLDLIFSFDSILTAIGMTEHVSLMITAIIISMIIMLWFAGPISRFIEKHPALQMLALSFLILIGFMLFIEGFGKHVEKAYIYFAVGFSLIVEVLNMRLRKKKKSLKQQLVDKE